MNSNIGRIVVRSIGIGRSSGSIGRSSGSIGRSTARVYRRLRRLLPKFWLVVLFTVLHKHASGDYRNSAAPIDPLDPVDPVGLMDSAGAAGTGGAGGAGGAGGGAGGAATNCLYWQWDLQWGGIVDVHIDGADGVLCMLQDLGRTCSLWFQFMPTHFFLGWEVHEWVGPCWSIAPLACFVCTAPLLQWLLCGGRQGMVIAGGGRGASHANHASATTTTSSSSSSSNGSSSSSIAAPPHQTPAFFTRVYLLLQSLRLCTVAACCYAFSLVVRVYAILHAGSLHFGPYTPYIHHTPYTVHRTPYTVHRTPYILLGTPYTVHCTAYTVHHTTWYTIHHTLYTILLGTPCTIHHTIDH
jgi:hypothetical protein